MIRTLGAGFLLVLAVGLYALYSAAFTVNEAQQALILRFGDPRRVIQEPGLHWKVPIADNIFYLDDRILDLDSPVQELIASDQKRLVVDAFARFRIADPLRFYQAVGTVDAAEARLATILNSALRRVLGEQTFFAVVRDQRDALMRDITAQVNREAQNFGIDVVDVRIRRADLPQANSEAIYRRMQTEREQEASQIRAEGEEQARRIRSRADRESTILVAEAQRSSEQIRGEGDALRNQIFANAYTRDPGFFDFYRSMQAYDNGLRGETTRFIMRPDSDFFRYFVNAQGVPEPGDATATGEAATGAETEEGATGDTPATEEPSAAPADDAGEPEAQVPAETGATGGAGAPAPTDTEPGDPPSPGEGESQTFTVPAQ
ncbi:protease modulator HflC [Lutibaculum baratangense]|uniref:HflC protein n=1 Tax=Lutibaculum baratangense AMV1 TaxID=631454 RepID=V4RPU4_9HYPH|nr:HflC protein [Lutibaculum baratangense AMV1]